MNKQEGLVKVKKEFSEENIINVLRTPDHKDTEEVISFFYESYKYLWSNSNFFKNLLPKETERQEMYNDAILDLVRVIKKKNFEKRAELKTLFISIFRNRCLDLIKFKGRAIRHNPDLKREPEINDISVEAKSAIDAYSVKEDLRLVKASLEKMDDLCRTILKLTAQFFSLEAIAHHVELTKDQVRYQLALCRKKLLKSTKGQIDFNND